tara:strand:- start:308 stop:868 length:561 start_codon:yes stop_codon:yes gene_type:complete
MSDASSKTISIRIAIDIPVDIASDTLAQLQPLVSQLSGLGKQQQLTPSPDNSHVIEVDPEAEAKKAEIKQHYADKIAEYKRNVIQAYRTFRRTVDSFDEVRLAYHPIAERYQWPVGVVQSAIADRKRVIRKYLQVRQKREILLLSYAGKTNKQIGLRLGLHDRTVARRLKEARNLKRLQTKGGCHA